MTPRTCAHASNDVVRLYRQEPDGGWTTETVGFACSVCGEQFFPGCTTAAHEGAVAAYKARLVEGVEGLTATFGQHTCWDNHEGGVDADGNPTLHADGSTCSDRIINESVLRAAVLRLIEEEAHRAE